MESGITNRPDRVGGFLALLGALALLLTAFAAAAADLKASVRRDLAYGADPLQTLDVYAPDDARKAPVIVMAHGGGWAFGDKASPGVAGAKADHFLAKGYVFVSANYRMIPAADPVEQAADLARAIAYVQANAAKWGGDPARVVLMGHSAGAHLVSLINADPDFAKAAGAGPWQAAISLDSGAYDVAAIMKRRHLPLFDHAFGKDKAFWREASPLLRIRGEPAPMLLVCSSRRKDSCAQAAAFQAALQKQTAKADLAPQDLSHREINVSLGEDSDYTRRVDAFLQAQGLP